MPRGALLPVSFGERPSLDRVLTGPSADPFGSLNLVGGLRRSMAKSGYSDLKEFQKVGLTVAPERPFVTVLWPDVSVRQLNW